MSEATAATALQALKDAPLPAPPEWTPQTTACYVALVVIALLVVALIVWRLRQRRADAYRRLALTELGAIEPRLADEATRPAAVLALAALLKRCALAVRPRTLVAPLSGKSWRAWLATSSGATARERNPSLDELVYGSGERLASEPEPALRELGRDARHWIEHHSRKLRSGENR